MHELDLTTSYLIMDDSSSSESDEPLTPLRIQFLDETIYEVLMASSDVDQKFLGKFAQQTERDDPLLSAVLYQILGLSVLLSKKLFRARRLRRLDVTRDTRSMQLYYHIIWLSREGLILLEEYVLPSVRNYSELKVLAYKLRGSFYHIFVLFHNQPSVNLAAAAVPGAQGAGNRRGTARSSAMRQSIQEETEDLLAPTQTGQTQLPPGLAPISLPKPAASFLLPARDYIPDASRSFDQAMALAVGLLSGSHPLRLSVVVEYCAYLYDCLHDGDGSRKLAKTSIRAVYNATEGMDDETFNDSAMLVGVLGKMMKRGLGSSTGTAPSVANTTNTQQSSPRSRQARSTTASRTQQPSTTQVQQSPRQAPSQSSRTASMAAPPSPKAPHRRDTAQRSPRQAQAGLQDSNWAAAKGQNYGNNLELSTEPLYRTSIPRRESDTLGTPPPLPPKDRPSPREVRVLPSLRTQKLPPMTPWEAPSPDSARRKSKLPAAGSTLSPTAMAVAAIGYSPPSMRGGGRGENGRQNGHGHGHGNGHGHGQERGLEPNTAPAGATKAVRKDETTRKKSEAVHQEKQHQQQHQHHPHLHHQHQNQHQTPKWKADRRTPGSESDKGSGGRGQSTAKRSAERAATPSDRSQGSGRHRRRR